VSRLAVLRVAAFRWFFLGSLASLVGDFMAPVALVFAVLAIGGPGDLGLVLAARIVPLVAFMLIGGVIADRLPRRAVMLGADAARAVSQGLLAFLLLTGTAHVWELAVLQVAHGAASAVFTPAISGLVQQTVPVERLQEANSLRGLAQSIGQLAGPAISGALVALTGPGEAIAVDAATFAFSAYCLSRLPRGVAAARVAARTMLGDLRVGWREFTARRWVWTIILASSIMNGLQAAWTVLGPVAAVDRLGGPAAWGFVLTCGGGGAVLGGLITLWLRTEAPLRTGVLVVLLYPAQILALALELPVVAVAAATLVSNCGLLVFNTLWETTLQRSVPADRLARVSAYEWMGSYACHPAGLLIVPLLASALGPRPILWTAALAMTALTLPLLLVPGVRSGSPTAEPPPREAPAEAPGDPPGDLSGEAPSEAAR
jgi:MFS family permease